MCRGSQLGWHANVTRCVPEDARARSIMLITQVSLAARNKPIHRMALAEIRLRLLRERSLSMSTSIMLTIRAQRPVELATDREGTNARSGVRGKWNSVTCVSETPMRPSGSGRNDGVSRRCPRCSLRVASIKCRICVLFVPLHGAKRERRENVLLAAGYRGIRIERRNEMRIGFLTDSLHRTGDSGDSGEGGRAAH